MKKIENKTHALSRRKFIKLSAMASSALLATSYSSAFSANVAKKQPSENNHTKWFMPDESEPHLRTWMAFAANEDIWGKDLLPEVHRNLAKIAKTIAKFEPVSMLVSEEDYETAYALVGSSVELIVSPLDDLWMRDTGPVFVISDMGEKAAIQFNFNGWGKKQDFQKDAKVAAAVARKSNSPTINTRLILEGGGIEVDGHGTAIITESCVLNKNRNPNITKAQCELELKKLLGIEKVIWLPGIIGKDITDGHTDFYARFAKPGVVVAGYDADPDSFDHAVTKKHLSILRKATDAEGRKLKVVVMRGPNKVRKEYENADFAAGYINFYVCNGAVIAPEFGDVKADNAAKKQLMALFPKREIVQINIDGIAAGGGGIHCTTQQEPDAG